MIQIYASRSKVAEALNVDPRTVKKMIDDKKVLVVMFRKKVRYIIAKEVFEELAR